ncbi:MAG TPA: argininosuccinate lyase [Tepidisphaeraceae bacterium]|jgi:argininosuccinate lyase|nr:argininosuccinate lyase [Tepidisphaeraceae bacterium]
MAEPKSWQARIGEATDALAQSFVESISYDRRMYAWDIAGSIAHAAMLEKAGLLSPADHSAIIDGLRGIERDIKAGNFVFDASLEDIHMVIEKALTDRIGEPGRKLHTARSRNDQVALDLSLWLRGAGEEVAGKLHDLCRAYVAMAQRSGDIVMPSYTHLQRAQPIAAGAECLAWCTMLWRDAERCDGGFTGALNDIPLGSGAIAGSSLPIDSSITAGLLGYSSPPISSIEQTASRDQGLEFLFAMAMISMHLSRWAEQWIIYSTTEFSFIKTADRYTTGSSMMPQKRNPDMLELVRGRCATVYGDLLSLLTLCKGLPIGYNRDLQEDKRVIFRAFDTVSSCVVMAAAIVSATNFVRENIEPTLERGFLDATSLAEYLVGKGVPFRTAHHIVGSLVARCEKEGKTALAQLQVADFAAAAKAAGADPASIGADVYESLGSRNVVKRYRSPGAAGGEPYRQRLAEWEVRLGVYSSSRS